MIYTLTINPSLDYVMELDNLTKGSMNRSKNTYLLPGGKGINVSQVLNALGVENIAILPVAGFTGEKLLRLLDEKGIDYDAVKMEWGDTRINVKVLGEEETELNAAGPTLSETEKNSLLGKIDKIKGGDFLILSGSVPTALGMNFYAEIMKELQEKNIKVVVDTIGANFLNALPYHPFLVKPNKEELKALFTADTTIGTTIAAKPDTDTLELAKRVQKMGARNVLVSMGGDGAMLLTEGGDVYHEKAPKGTAINTVGSGDSMVAGFIAGVVAGWDFSAALKQGIAAGSASAFSKNLATKEEIDALMENL